MKKILMTSLRGAFFALMQSRNVLSRLLLSLTITLCLPLPLTGCLSPVKSNNNATYMLFRTPDSLPKKHEHQASIMVQQPFSAPAYDTTQMAYTTMPYKIAYFSQNSWAETPAQMIEPLMVQTLQKSHYFKTVLSTPYVGHYDYLLTTTILMLEQDFLTDPSVMRFKLRAQLSNTTNGRVVATKEFSVTQPVRMNTPYGGVLAANAAVSRVLSQIAIFCQKNTNS
jgi:cholesterol transport system auxiliary component